MRTECRLLPTWKLVVSWRDFLRVATINLFRLKLLKRCLFRIWLPHIPLNDTIKSQKNENNHTNRNSAKQHPTETIFQPFIIVGNISSALFKNVIKQVSFGVDNTELFCAYKRAEVLESQGHTESTQLPLHGGISENSVWASTACQR